MNTDTLNKIFEEKIIAVIRANSKEEATKAIRALIEGGIKLIEITLTVPFAVDLIKELTKEFEGDDVILGAGTVRDSETARSAILNDAKFIVSPYLNEPTAKLCSRYGIPYMPGCMTVKECADAMETGCDIVKLFSANQFGPSFVKGIKGPLPQLKIMPTGLVDLDSLYDWLDAGVVAVGVGSALVGPAKTGNYDAVTKNAKNFVSKIQAYDMRR